MIYHQAVSSMVMERDTDIPVIIENIGEVCSGKKPESGKEPSD